MFDKLKEECGVFGIWGHPEASNLTYLGLHALQHRGQEAAGIVSSDGTSLHLHKELGLVTDVFDAGKLAKLPGSTAIGHVRYSTAGGRGIKNTQPFAVDCGGKPLAIAHNGNLVNAESARRTLEGQGAIFFSSSDTEVVLHLVARQPERELTERIRLALEQVHGAYSLLFLSDDQLIGVRDPRGFRPLILGKLKGAWILASETCALDLIEAEYVREIEPGEMVVIDRNGVKSLHPFAPAPAARCVFEHVYFARPDSLVFGRSVYESRTRQGAILAKEHPVEADLVIPCPDSGVPAAIGYAEASGIPFGMGIVRSHYVGRTFIEPTQQIRHFGVKLKLNALRRVLEGKRVVVVDDSIVRGTTSRKVVKMLRAAGAKEIHMRISSPPTSWPCYYGVDTPTRSELISASHSVEEIAKYITADTLGYLSLEGLYESVGSDGKGFCDACFSGKYPVSFPVEEEKRLLRVVEA
ncbi:amidophosphoribosyltransferase [Vulgatibacter incomptus]|uniref:Amidophosphoribosyltransferase n=1 Tax=Vulgatibacter incomptus TaxID=1391653 RepID=A0A0K1P982_9BACT|nr:amidophosphoribosyltransferase [Vulgatibacter incomptus]AKU89664.1 Amidophosphoribosyltransferase [Vulgatibacter incomptus]